MTRGFQALEGAVLSAPINFWDTTARVPPISKPQLHSAVTRGAERGKSEHLRVMLARQIISASEDRHVPIDFVFGRNVQEIVIFDVDVRSEEERINFLTRIHPFRLNRRAESVEPEIRTGKVDFVARPAGQTRALGRWNVRRRSFLRF